MDQTDESGVRWQRVSDGLGRLSAVVELGTQAAPLHLETDYGYDALNNLTAVIQLGASGETPRIRGFSYDPLSRLIYACNPESLPQGLTCDQKAISMSYAYDAKGNLTSETDARGAKISYTYDVLNRLTNKQSAGASGVPGFNYSYGYDAVDPPEANEIGRLLWTSNGTGEAEQYFYDVMGRMTSRAVNTAMDICCVRSCR